MVFITLAVIGLIISIYFFFVNGTDYYTGWVLASFILVICLIVTAAASYFAQWFADNASKVSHEASIETVDLKALGSSSSVEGRYFYLGGGYINGVRVLNYTTVYSDGSMKVQQADGPRSTIYESSDKPVVKIHHWEWNSPWNLPGVVVARSETYEFFIPKGSVVESYNVGTK